MKIDTAECKKALEAKYGKGNWKRTSKMKDGENTIRHFSKDGDDSYIVASHTDKGIYCVDKLDMDDVPNGDAEKLVKNDYKSSKGVLQALSNLHPIFIQWLETQFDPDNCGSFKEYMDNSDGTVFCDLDGCLEWAKEVHGINMMDDEEADKKGSALIEQHLKDNVPADFPYIIQTEDYMVLWRPAPKAGMIIASIEDLPQDKLEMEKWLNGEVEKNRKLKENQQALQDRLDEFDALKKKGVTGSKTVPAGKYIFCLKESDMMDGEENNYFVLINTVAHWNETGYLCDSYEDDECEEINVVAEEIGLSEMMESTFSFINKISKEDARKLLLARGFGEDEAFNKKMEECS